MDIKKKIIYKDRLKGIQDKYDNVVIGSGLAGMTAANMLAKAGHTVLLLEHVTPGNVYFRSTLNI